MELKRGYIDSNTKKFSNKPDFISFRFENARESIRFFQTFSDPYSFHFESNQKLFNEEIKFK